MGLKTTGHCSVGFTPMWQSLHNPSAFSLYEIYFTWMTPKAARNTVSLYEGASPRVTGLNLDQQIESGPTGEKPWDKPQMKTHPRSTGSYLVRTRVRTCYLPFSVARGLVSPMLTTQPQSRLLVRSDNKISTMLLYSAYYYRLTCCHLRWRDLMTCVSM